MATMFILNPTRENVTRMAGGKDYHIPAGQVLQVEDSDIGNFLIEARGEMAAIPQGGLTWFGLVPIKPDEDVKEVAKRGLQNWLRLLNHRLLAMDALIQEGTTADGKQNFQAQQALKDKRFLVWRDWLAWVESVLAGEIEYEEMGALAAVEEEVKPERQPKGVKIRQQSTDLDSSI